MPLTYRRIDTLDDARGLSLPVGGSLNDVFAAVEDCHVTTIRPGHHRGNHVHERRAETLLVIFQDGWTLHWDDGDGTVAHHEPFAGSGLVIVSIPAGSAHAISNEGTTPLVVIGLSNGSWDPDAPDAHPRNVM